ncbi:MAG: oxidoreductase [Parachlamydia sp.]|nr:MAG: oxidoreductase [Parachlamydia sp.]
MSQKHTFEQALKNAMQGEVRFDEISRTIYSVDASIYEVEPVGVVLPNSREDLIKAVHIAYAYQMAIIPRGAATGITGGCLGKGLIIDTSKYLNHILHIDYTQELATCEPGVVQDNLNAELAKEGYRLGPDTSTGNRATLGGMLANNAAGARSLRYGKMVDHVHAVELLLATGECISLHEVDEATFIQKQSLPGPEGAIYRAIQHIRATYAEEVRIHFPNIPRRVSGYNLDEIMKPFPLNLSKIIAGSEGTLGICTKITMKICKKPIHNALCLLFFQNLTDALNPVSRLLAHQPLSLELIDEHIIEAGKKVPSLKNISTWIPAAAKFIVFVEFDGETIEQLNAKLQAFEADLTHQQFTAQWRTLREAAQIAQVWELRKAGLGLLLSKRSYSRAIAFIEDVAVPPAHLLSFMQKLNACLKEHHKEAGIYGHIGAGCIHVRPYIDLRDPQDLIHMKQIMESVSDSILEEGGSMSGEHGDGLVRSWLNPKMFGEKLIEAFKILKRAFDPHLRMNPGKIVFPSPFLENLRLDPNTPLFSPETFLNFSAEGGFDLAVDMCNGNGRCRKEEGTMCPSFQATKDEYDSTRARAQALRALIHDRLEAPALAHEGIHDVLDLCLECKACKTECPSQVDMAKMKAEMTYHYQKKHGIPWRSYLFGHIGYVNQLLFPIRKVFNWALQQNWFKSLQAWGGIASQRTLPSMNAHLFSSWFKKYQQPSCQKQVVLLNDTFTEFNEAAIGISAVKVLNTLGFNVQLPPWKCCGRPLISKGMLAQARQQANLLIDTLYPYAAQGLPIIGLEPSCILTVKDDFQALTKTRQDEIKTIIQQCVTFDEFLAENIGCFPPLKAPTNARVKLHIHCHQKALVGVNPSLKVLRSLPGYQIELIPAGCCGMAGSFGYEKEHYALSLKIGELHLFPAVRELKQGQHVIANGISCRSQIFQGTEKKALHLAQFLAEIFSSV